jgi:hypothetical protein
VSSRPRLTATVSPERAEHESLTVPNVPQVRAINKVGSTWHAVAGVPSSTLGIRTDWAINTVTGDIYEKTGHSTWTQQFNLSAASATLDMTGDTPFNWNMYTYGPSGSAWKTTHLLRAEMAGNHPTNDLSVLAIEARPEGSGKNGPAYADFGLSISAIKKNWDSVALPGEVDALNIVLRNGGVVATGTDDRADSAAVMINAFSMAHAGWICGVEGIVGNNDGAGIKNMIGFQIGGFDGPINRNVGMTLSAYTGTFYCAYFAQNVDTGTFVDFLHFQGADGANLFKITGSGRVIGGDTTASTSSTTGSATFAGGLGVAGASHLGGQLHVNGSSVGWVGPSAMSLKYAGGAGGPAFILRPEADPGMPLLFLGAAGGAVGSVSTTDTTTSFNTTSDGRLKEDLRPFDSGAMIDAIETWDFRWKNLDERSFGVIAQDAAKVVPQACHHDESIDHWGTDYSKFVPILLAEMKALRARMAELEGGAVTPRGKNK